MLKDTPSMPDSSISQCLTGGVLSWDLAHNDSSSNTMITNLFCFKVLNERNFIDNLFRCIMISVTIV